MSPRPTPIFSLVVPTYNESANIAAFLARISAVLDARLPGNYEIIVVDDDSPDLTWDLAAAAARALPSVRIIRRQNEKGLATAVVAGWQTARGAWLGVIDADLQHPPEVVAKLIDAIEAGADLAVGSRHVAGGGVSSWSFLRRIISRGAQAIGLLLLPAARRIADPMSGLFVVRRDRLDLSTLRPVGYKILLEVLVRGHVPRIAEIGYVFEERSLGSSKATLKVYWEYLVQVWTLRKARTPASRLPPQS
ncbi:MAG: polyprenol monophosphomannose synthase [Opitutus sp.]|nr:polyprenol monophosphomannose synthase [Opitutus sp.]